MAVENLDRDVQFRGLSAEQREMLMIQVAKRYYELDMTMGDLSKELGLTRWQASRLLTEARETGVPTSRAACRSAGACATLSWCRSMPRTTMTA
jgi:ferredoxin